MIKPTDKSSSPINFQDQLFDIRATEVTEDQNKAYDQMLKHSPVVKNKDANSYMFFKHRDVKRILENDRLFSAQASKHLFVPHGLDEPDHSKYRRAIGKAFTNEKMLPLLAKYEQIAVELLKEVKNTPSVFDAARFAFYFTARVELALLNWDLSLDKTLIDWTLNNLRATLHDDKKQNIANANEWNHLIYTQLNARRAQNAQAINQTSDLTDDLLNIQINGKPMPDAEISSLIRNLNMGLVSSMACNITNCIHFLATHPDIQQQIRNELSLLDEALDEITRLHGSLVQSKRVATEDVEFNGIHIKKGQFVHVNWCSANRDGDVFDNPDQFQWGRDHSEHLMYGYGTHECMGIQLARIQLKIAMYELFKQTDSFTLSSLHTPEKLVFPANGYRALIIELK